MDFEKFFHQFFGNPNPFYRYIMIKSIIFIKDCMAAICVLLRTKLTSIYRPDEEKNEKKDESKPTGKPNVYNQFDWQTELQQMDVIMARMIQEMFQGFPMLNQGTPFPIFNPTSSHYSHLIPTSVSTISQ